MDTSATSVGRITPVILSGGSGTRLWPLSRKSRPKQMLSLLADETMLQLTAARTAANPLFGAPVVVTAAAQAEQVVAQLGKGIRLILEPCGRNTAAAVALAALAAAADDVLLVMPSDHLMANPARFVEAVVKGVAAADRGILVTFGVHASRPETGFGYIQCGEAIGDQVFRATRFLEKPDLATAAEFLADGRYRWNAGIFLFTAGGYLEALAEHAGDILDGCRKAMAQAKGSPERIAPDEDSFSRIRPESIDRAVMERASNVAVVPVDVGWSDLGSWEALHAASVTEPDGNSVIGPADLLEASNCLVRSNGPRIVAIGVKDLAIVATRDAVLVVPLDQSQRVGEAVARVGKLYPDVT